jgi:hypothetical protein
MRRRNRIPHIERVRVVRPHTLELHFDDGLIRTLEFIPGQGGAVFTPLDDLQFFANVTVDHGTIAWPNGLDLAPPSTAIESPSAGRFSVRSVQSSMAATDIPGCVPLRVSRRVQRHDTPLSVPAER